MLKNLTGALAACLLIAVVSTFAENPAVQAGDCETVYFSRSESGGSGCREVWMINGIYYATAWYTCGDHPYDGEAIKLALRNACKKGVDPVGFVRVNAY